MQMNAELQVLSPLVPVRNVNFLRFCKQHAEGVWAVVDVSIDPVRENSGGSPVTIRRLPSGCIVQDMSNGYSKVNSFNSKRYIIVIINKQTRWNLFSKNVYYCFFFE